MFEKITPEKAGISSRAVAEYISLLERYNTSTHGLVMMKGDKIFAENYWAPFNKDFCHRMYSQTKSFVSVAIGLLIEDGKLSLDDKICELFPEKLDTEPDKYMREQTLKDMLTMCTVGQHRNWFTAGDPDRTHLYFADRNISRPSSTLWEYDSAGSQVMCNLVEKLAGKSMFDFLNERIFSHLGTFKSAKILKTPNGVSWGDSAMLCTVRDAASFGRFVMNYGTWEGKRLMNEEYLREATSAVVDNAVSSHFDVYHGLGYGYQFWRIIGNGFAMVGMGDQLTLCYPDEDIIMSITSDNQGSTELRQLVVGAFYELIVRKAQSEALPEDKAAEDYLAEMTKDLKLRAIKGKEDSPMREVINGKVYECEQNKMGIKRFSFVFKDATEGEFRYENEQGEKVIPFGVNRNVFGKFPELGYSDEFGAMRSEGGFMYDDAVSLTWLQDNRLILYVQIIDRYFGNMSAIFGFKGDDCAVRMEKTAEDFLDKYQGSALAHLAK